MMVCKGCNWKAGKAGWRESWVYDHGYWCHTCVNMTGKKAAWMKRQGKLHFV